MSEPAVLKLGDCGQILPTVPDASVGLIVTDPPYGISYRSNRQRVDRKHSVAENESVVVRKHYFDRIANDDAMPTLWLKDAYRTLRPDSALYVFLHWSMWGIFSTAVEGAGFSVKNMIVLNKSNHGMGDKFAYAPKHELLLFATKGRHVCRWPNGRMSNVWNVPVKFSGAKRFHPNEKPASWIEPAILNSSDEGDLILDPFMGSGTTGVVCAKAGRRFYGVEKDGEHYATAVERVNKEYRSVAKLIDW
jgi:site-specific DNA-methyltransferase (adenine-specific)